MRTSTFLTTAAAVAALVAMTGCEPGTTSAQPISPTPADSTAASAAPSTATATAAATGTAADSLAAAVAATRAVSAAFVRYAATGFDTLTATSWAAQVTTSPPSATGSANLLVDGQRIQTDFEVAGGRLHIQNSDGAREDVGAARGVLDPPALLDSLTGLSALLASVTDAHADAEPAVLNDRPMVRLRAQLPSADARLLLPADALAGHAPLPVTLWLDPAAGDVVRQLIITTGTGAVTVTVDPTPR